VITRIKLEYDARQRFPELAVQPDKLEILKDIFGDGVPEPENYGHSYMWPDETLIDLDNDGPRLTALGLTFVIKSFKGTMPLKAVLPEGHEYTVYVQVPHIGLLAIDEVQVCEDYCTDALQRELNSGWRILCVCPPNAARRPDYILGRTKGNDR
jgi:hypothetical protein